jgi:hypothetical protein
MLNEATMSETAQAAGFLNGAQPNQQQADARLRVQFGPFPQINQEKTTAEGRPIYDDILYIMIYVPGERDVVHRKAYEGDKQRFPFQYQAYMNKQNQDTAGGTPLKVVPWLTLGQVKELEFFNCYTVEQLAAMPDSNISKFHGIQKLKQNAKDFLAAAKEAAPLIAMRAEIDQRDDQIAALQNQMADLVKRLDKQEEAKKDKTKAA